MTRLFLVGVSLAVVAGGIKSVQAADLPIGTPPLNQPAVASGAFVPWTGCFVGTNGGVTWARWNLNETTTPFLNGTKSAQGMALGGQIGCDYQVGSWVFGVQGLGDGTPALKTSFALVAGTPVIQNQWMATATGRIGYSFEPGFLPYIRGGLAWADQQSTGWTLGGGLEWKFLPNWSAFVEYDYLLFGNRIENPALLTPVTLNIGLNVQAVLFGLNYRFDLGPPVTTRY